MCFTSFTLSDLFISGAAQIRSAARQRTSWLSTLPGDCFPGGQPPTGGGGGGGQMHLAPCSPPANKRGACPCHR